MTYNHLILYHPLLLLPSIFPSLKVFSNVSSIYIRSPKFWSLALVSVLPMNIQSWLPLRLTSLISLLSKGQYSFESNSSLVLSLHYDQILQPYVTTEKIIALTIQTFVGKMMSLLFNTLSRFIITFLPNGHMLCCAKSLQPCMTFFNPMDCSPPVSSVHGDASGKNTAVGCHTLLLQIKPADLWLLHWQTGSLPVVLPRKPNVTSKW